MESASRAKEKAVMIQSNVVRCSLDECDEFRARRFTMLAIKNIASAQFNKGRFALSLAARNGQGLISFSSDDHSTVHIRAVVDGRRCHFPLALDIEGSPVSRAR